MELPPRRSRKLQEITIRRNRTNLDVLMQMGFPQHRAEKSLAATGDKGVQLASDWLLSHVNDTTLDESTPRDYILYLCPVGRVQQELLDFWQKSYQLCGWNRAHNYFPHVTLCSFFKSEDAQISKLAHSLKTVCERLKNIPDQLPLEYFSSANFIGLFVSDSMAAILKQITSDFAEEVRKIGVNVDPHRKQLHISLLYQFPTEHKERVENLAKSINLSAPVRWDIRLYSRDARYAKHQVRKVRFPHTPQDDDELELSLGDFIYVEEAEIEASPDGWYPGTSWQTGNSGLFPGNYTERGAETETWTMHRSIPIVGTDQVDGSTSDSQNEHHFLRYSPHYDDPWTAGQQTLPTRSLLRNQGAIPKRPRSAIQTSTPPLTSPKLEKKTFPGEAKSSTSSSSSSNSSAAAAASSSKSSILQRQSSDPKLKSKPPKSSVGGGSSGSGGASGGASASSVSSASSPSSSNSKHSPGYSNSTGGAIGGSSGSSPIHTRSNLSSPIVEEEEVQNGTKYINSTNSITNNTTTTTTMAMTATAAGAGATGAGAAGPGAAGAGDRTTAMKGLQQAPQQRTGEAGKTAAAHKGPRQLYVVRHGERIDFTFGKDWIQNSFDSAGHYIRYDLNMPKSLPKRKGGPSDFHQDSPLTVQGHFQAKLVGEALHEKNIPITHIYASPSLRCVETATEILGGLGLDIPIYIEPGLFEWLGWYRKGMPRFLTAQEFRECGFNVATQPPPVWPQQRYNMEETTEQYYERCHFTTKEILARHETEGGNVMLVAHAASLDVCTRQLVGQAIRSFSGFHDVIIKVPYCALAVAQEGVLVRDTWYLIEPPTLPFAHTNNAKYNWTCLTTPTIH